MVSDVESNALIQSVINMDRVYKRRGLRTPIIHMGGNFDTYRIQSVVVELNITLNLVSEYNRVPEVERYIITIK